MFFHLARSTCPFAIAAGCEILPAWLPSSDRRLACAVGAFGALAMPKMFSSYAQPSYRTGRGFLSGTELESRWFDVVAASGLEVQNDTEWLHIPWFVNT